MDDRLERWLRRVDYLVTHVGWVVLFLAVIWITGSVALHIV